MKIVELLIDELDELTGVDAVALVEQPAIEADFFAFKNQNIEDVIEFNFIKLALEEHLRTGSYESIIDDNGKPLFDTIEEAERVATQLGCEGHHEHEIDGKIWYMPCKEHSDLNESSKFSFALEEDQQMVVGPLMIPDKLILRTDENNDPYYIYFSKATVQKIAEKLMRNKFLDNLNLEHNPEQPVKGHMVSTWIVEDKAADKQGIYGMDLPQGTWMGQYKIEDSKTWQMVKDGLIKGFSVEGFFQDKFIQASKNI